MAIDYQDLFGNLGSVLHQINECENDLGLWDQRQDEIQTSFEASNQQVALDGLIQYVNSVQSQIANMRSTLGVVCDKRLQDFATVVQILGIPSNNVGSILYALINQMIGDSQTIHASVVTVGSVTAGSLNTGNGTVVLSKILDGFSSPKNGAQTHPAYFRVDSEFPVTESEIITCTQDSYASGVTAGKESFSWNGQLALSSIWAEGAEGSGNGPPLSTLQAGNIIQNQDFENWTVTDTPDNWTISAGVVTTNVKQETSTIYRGSSSVKLLGTGIAAVRIVQLFPINRLKPLKMYCCSVRYQASATDGGGVAFTVKPTGTGYTAGTTEKATVAGGSFPTSWTLGTFFFLVPAAIPSDFSLTIELTGTPAVNMFVDDIGLNEVSYHNGICAAVVAGSTNFVLGDRFTFSVSNDDQGLFSKYMTRNYLVQLPSSTTGAETISDNFAT